MPNSIKHLIDLLQQQELYSEDAKRKNDYYMEQLKENGMFALTPELYQYVATSLDLGQQEMGFLEKFCKLDDETKRYMLEDDLLTSEEKQWLKGVIDNTTVALDNKKQEENEDIATIIKKLKGKNVDFLHKEEIEKLAEIIKNQNMKTSDILDMMLALNGHNETFKKNVIDVETVEPVEIDEDSLEETNLDEKTLSELLEKYGVDLLDIKLKFRTKLLKYGDLTNIGKVLGFLKESEILDIISNKSEILVKTLVYSKVELLEDIKNLNDIEFREIVTKNPTVLFPTVRERTRRLGGSGGSGGEAKSGSLYNYQKNSALIKELGLNVETVWETCPTFFYFSHKTIMEAIKGLELYGISLKDPTRTVSLSTIVNSTLLDGYDMALESGCLDYILENPSRMSAVDNLYLVKVAKKQDIADNIIFGIFKGTDNKKFLRTSKLYKEYLLPADKEGLFEEYNAVNVEVDKALVYDNICDISYLNTISVETLKDPLIKGLESYTDKDNSEVYNFNGTVISKRKVLRHYSALLENGKAGTFDSLLYCVIKNSMLDEHEYKNVYDSIREAVNLEPEGDIKVTVMRKGQRK